MSKAIADADALEQFARELRTFSVTLKDRMSHLKGRYAALGETWQDQEEAKFAREFEQTMRVLEQFLRVADPQVPYLQRKAQRIREYLGQR